MRLPRQDTPLRLPAEPPQAALAADEALLDAVQPGRSGEARLDAAGPNNGCKCSAAAGAERSDRAWRWWVASSPAVVVGLGLHHRLSDVLDLERCAAAGVEVIARRAGGGAVLLGPRSMLCGAVAVPTASIPSDVTESYRWLGERFVTAFNAAGVNARAVAVAEARADIAALRDTHSPLLNTCFGALSPYEVLVDDRKLVGLAQVRRRTTALFQFGILLEDQAPLADFIKVPDAASRESLRERLRQRTVGLSLLSGQSAFEVALAVADAMPSAP